MLYGSGYRFTKGLTQNLNLRTPLKLEYNIKKLKLELCPLFFGHDQWFKSF